jgi:hypothetical protein
MSDLKIILIIILVAAVMAAIPMVVRGDSGNDPNCTLISHDGNLKTFYCFNPENGDSYYRNNFGFIALGKG